MGKKDEEKSRRKHKHHKFKTTKPNIEKPQQQIVVEEVEIDVDYQSGGNTTPSHLDQTTDDAFMYDEDNLDIEVEEVTLDYSGENTKTTMEEEQQIVEVVEKFKKSGKKQENIPTPPPAPTKAATSTPAAGLTKKSKKRRESGTSSEEERWLTAIESGKLEEVEDVELRKMKDPKLMTARQRAMYDRNNETESAPGFTETLIALPTGYKEKEKPQTAEEIQKAALKTLKRKQQADEKREKDKKKTMERLLKKQESKNRSSTKPKTAKDATPVISYRNTLDGAFVHLPVGVDFPLQPQAPIEPPPRQLCGIQGCGQPKVYNCSKTNVPLCSFACYRKNVQSSKEIIC